MINKNLGFLYYNNSLFLGCLILRREKITLMTDFEGHLEIFYSYSLKREGNTPYVSLNTFEK
jgi:hypothetical protein